MYNAEIMSTETPPRSRSEYSADDLRPYKGKWVAISEDGKRIVAAAESLAELDRLVVVAGEDPQAVGLERIELEESAVGGAEIH